MANEMLTPDLKQNQAVFTPDFIQNSSIFTPDLKQKYYLCKNITGYV